MAVKEKTQRVEIRVTPAWNKRLREYAKAQDMKVSDLVRLAVTWYMRSRKSPAAERRLPEQAEKPDGEA